MINNETNREQIKENILRLRELQEEIEANPTKELMENANEISNNLISVTKNTYDRMSKKYATIRTLEISGFDIALWNDFLEIINKYCNKDFKKLKLLDIGTGHGRDLKYAIELGFNAIGTDNSDGFIRDLEELSNKNIISKDVFVKSDMRKLPFEDKSFDIVRQQASLLHLPLIGKGYTVDKALSEDYRVLKKDGLLYVLVKKGQELTYVDTNEGLGGRIFQLYSEEKIRNVIERNGFKIVSLETKKETRNGKEIEWISIFAKKDEK